MPGLYRTLIVWQKAMLLVQDIYRLTKTFPKYELNNLCDQMQRAAVSIPSNIAEGQYRFSPTQNKQYLRIAYGSCAELDTQLDIAINLKYVTQADTSLAISLLDKIMRILNTLITRASARP